MATQPSQAHAAFFAYLLLSALGPGEAARHVQISTEGTAAGGAKQEAGEGVCPAGLREGSPNGTAKVCYFDGPALGSAVGSKAPLIFEPYGGVFELESQFIAEFATALSDKGTLMAIATAEASLESEKNHTFRTEYEAFKHNFHAVEENLKPGFFVLEHGAEHLFIEGLEVGLHALEHAAAHGAVLGQEVVAQILGVSLEVLAEGAAIGVGVILHYVLPILLPFQVMHMAFVMRKHFKEKTHQAKDFAKHLTLKSDCMTSQLRMPGSVADVLPLLQDVVKDESAFAASTSEMLAAQIIRTNAAMMDFFEALQEVGRCLWPHAGRAWSKTNCAISVSEGTHEYSGSAGILYAALTFMASYAASADELFKLPFYGSWFHDMFDISVLHSEPTMIPLLTSAVGKPPGDRAMACMNMLATHQAYERTFHRLRTGVRVWLRTFARDMRHMSVRDSWWPCQKVFRKLGEDAEGFCKHYDFNEGHGEKEHAVLEVMPCERVRNETLWPTGHE